MMSHEETDRDATNRALSGSLEAISRASERLESLREEAEQLFGSVSDCLFLFKGDQLEFSNEEAKNFLEEAGSTRSRILRILLRLGPDHSDDLPIQLQFQAETGHPLFLNIREISPIKIEEQVFYLIAADNQTAMEALEENARQIAATERRRIGRNLHDGLSQLLTSLSLQISAQTYGEENPQRKKEWKEISNLVNRTLENQTAITQRLENT